MVVSQDKTLGVQSEEGRNKKEKTCVSGAYLQGYFKKEKQWNTPRKKQNEKNNNKKTKKTFKE